MAQTTGILNAVEIKDGNYGPQVRLNVSGTWYDYGKFAPRGINEGDTVKVDFNTNERGYHRIVPRGLVKVDAKAAPVASAPPVASSGFAKPAVSYVDNKQEIISKQAALNTAIALMSLQIQVGGVVYPAKATAPDKFSAFNHMVLEEARRIYKLNTGNTWVLDEVVVNKPAVADDILIDGHDLGRDEYADAE